MIEERKKQCENCKTIKPLDYFPQQSHARDKKSGWCKACHIEYFKKWKARGGAADPMGRRAPRWDRNRSIKDELAKRNLTLSIEAHMEIGHIMKCGVSVADAVENFVAKAKAKLKAAKAPRLTDQEEWENWKLLQQENEQIKGTTR